MSIIRTTAMICLTLLICVGLFIYYGSIENRYKLIKADSGLYIFDKNSSVTNYCNTTNCRGLSSGMIMPHRNEFWGIPGVPMHPMAQPMPQQMMPQPGYYGAMTYLPVQSNQAYILQPVPQGMPQPMLAPQPAPQPPIVMPAPQPAPQPPVAAPAPQFTPVAPMPEPVVQAPAVLPPPPPPVEVDEDMGGAVPETAPAFGGEDPQMGMAPVDQMATPQGFGMDQQGMFPEGGSPFDQNTGGFEAADMGEPRAARGF